MLIFTCYSQILFSKNERVSEKVKSYLKLGEKIKPRK